METENSQVGEKKHLMCVPGQRLCLCDESTIPGQGTYERQGYIYSMLAGLVQIRQKDKMTILEVKSFGNQTIVPVAGDIVTAKVTVVNQRIAKCLINCVGDVTLNRTYRGLLRKEDVRSSEKDRVDMYKSFRPGDVILARVLPHTELHCYQLSTAENELGVVVAMAAESVISRVDTHFLNYRENMNSFAAFPFIQSTALFSIVNRSDYDEQLKEFLACNANRKKHHCLKYWLTQ
ncbi:Exosome complex component CSL4, partial [Pseudolycoriella hygida]